MRFQIFIACLFITSFSHAQQPGYKILKTYSIKSPGGWDYIALNNNRIYASHGTQVNILDQATGDSVDVILNTNGVHGIAFDNELKEGFTSNGRLNNVTVFNLETNKILGQIATGENPDAIFFEPFSKMIVTCNGRSKDLSFIDPVSQKVIATIPVGGKPEAAVSDNMGKLFVNIEDKHEVVVINTKTFTVENHWSLKPGESPTGLAIDRMTRRLFAGCDNKMLVVMDADNGKIIAQVSIGDGCDGVAFDEKRRVIITSNGEGNISVVKENTANEFVQEGDYPTKRGARTLAVDKQTGLIYLPTADFGTELNANGRPKMIPGSFQVLVVGQ
ncbi:MAG: YncE family protein [Ferruginibacter sp.]